MKPILLLFVISSLLGACKTNTTSNSENNNFEDCPLVIKYNTSQGSIIIQDMKISQTSIEHEYDNPVSATPSDTKYLEILNQVVLTEGDIEALKEGISESQFMALEKASYGATENERHYLSSIEVQTNCKTKLVKYRSNPSFDEAPEAFNTLEKIIQEFASKKRN